MRKFISAILILLLVLGSIVQTYAEDAQTIAQMQFDFSEAESSNGWKSSALNAAVNTDCGYVSLDADTQAASGKAEARFCSPKLGISGNDKLLISFDFMVCSSDAVKLNKYFYIVWSGDDTDASRKSRLVWIQDNTIRIGSSLTMYAQSDFYDVRHSMVLAVDIEQSTVSAYLDGELLSENNSFSGGEVGESGVQFMFLNVCNVNETRSVLNLYSFCATNATLLNITTKPSDKSEMVDVSETDKLTVNFATIPKGNVNISLYVSGLNSDTYEPVDEKFEINGFVASAKLTKPLEPLKKYKICVSDAEDFYLNKIDKSEYVFTTAPPDYSLPYVCITSPKSGEVAEEGSTVIITAKAGSDCTDIERVEFYANDILVFSDADYPYNCSVLISDEFKEYRIYAVVHDILGGSRKCDEIVISVFTDEPPAVKIEGDFDGKTFSLDEIPKISVYAADDSAVAYVELILDNKIIGRKASAPYVFDLGYCELGEHTVKAVAYDIRGKSASDAVKIYISQSYDSDLNDAVCIYDVKGRVKSRDDYGDICVGENLTLEYTASNAVLSCESDISFSSIDVNGSVMIRGLENDGETRIDIHGIIEFVGGIIYSSGTNIGEYEPDRKYRMLCRVDAKNKSFEFKLTDINSGMTAAETQTVIANSNFNSVALIRLTCLQGAGKDGLISCSNIKAYLTGDYPQIVSIVGAYGESPVSYDSKNIICVLSGEIGDIDLNSVKIKNELGDVEIESVKKLTPNEVAVTFKNNLESAYTYTVIFDENTKLASGSPFGHKIVGHFSVAPRELDVCSGFFTAVDDIFFTAKIFNSALARNVTVVMVTYENGVVKEIISKTCAAEKGETIVTTPKLSIPSVNPSVAAFIIDGWATRIPVSSKIFTYNFTE